jgi:hypothetical protein
MIGLARWGASAGREANSRGVGQVFGTLIHHALLLGLLRLAPFLAPCPVPVMVICTAELAALVLATSSTASLRRCPLSYHTERVQLDAKRQARLERAGYHIVRVSHELVIQQPAVAVERVRVALEQCR